MNKYLIYILTLVLLLTGCSHAKMDANSGSPVMEEDAYLEQEADKIANEFKKGDYILYYTNEERTTLEEITVYFDFSNLKLTKEIESILNNLANIQTYEELKHSTAKSIIPEGMVMEYAVDVADTGTIVKIYMSEAYDTLPPNASVVMRTGINKAIYNLGLVSGIEYYVKRSGQNELVSYSNTSEQVLLNQYDNNFYTDEVTLRLHYADDEEEKLLIEERTVTLNMTDTMQEAVIKELIKGPQTEGAVNLFPEGAKVNSVWIKDGICYVDLNSEVQKRFVGSIQDEELLIYSIVNSLCGLSGIEYVQILIDGERVDVFFSNVSIYAALAPNEELVITGNG